MRDRKVYRAVGLMSGTSLDGVDAALIETDGQTLVRPLGFVTCPYDAATREKIRACFGKMDAPLDVVRVLTEKHIEAVRMLLKDDKADVIGFHGQTIHHDPAQKITVQIGDAALLARETGVPVVFDFRKKDVEAGGQGAPLLPLYHRARSAGMPGSLAVLNLGGVGNVTYIDGDTILAFDTGPGNALLDDWVQKHTGADYDADGRLAAGGRVDKKILGDLLAHPYFDVKPPKSLDRNAFEFFPALSVEDGAATLAAFTVGAVKKSLAWFPDRPKQWLVAGGGRHNRYLMEHLGIALNAPVNPVEIIGWNGDALEAEGFAYLAVRSLLGEAISLPSTTGVPSPLSGGALFKC